MKMILSRIFRLKRLLISEISVLGSRCNHQLTEYREETCQYPSIFDTSDEGYKRYYRQMWYDSVKILPSVEQKLHEMAVQQLVDLKTYTLSAVPSTYVGVDFHSYISRTHLINGLPRQISEMNVEQEYQEIKDVFHNILVHNYCNFWNKENYKTLHEFNSENDAGSKLINRLISQCYKKLSLKNECILNSCIQQRPRIFSFWWHGGYGKDDDEVHEKNLCFQYEDYSTLAIRMKQPLLPILDINDPLCSTAEVANYHYHPDVLHIPSTTNKVASVPAFWPGDPCEFPFLQVYTSDKLLRLISKLEKYDLNKIEDAVGVLSSFAWLNAVATYQGFTPFHDVTYPIVTQTILSNGQDWRFFIYQLNTIGFHNDVDNKNRRNICWSSGTLRLFDSIEDGQIKGINDEVFKILLKFLHNAPQFIDGVVMKPYLGTDTRTIDEKVHQRYFLRKMYSRVPDHMAHLNEVPAWVKIYKLHKDAPVSPLIKLE